MAVQIDANEGQINFHNEQHKQSGLLSTWLKITRKFNEGQEKKKNAKKGNGNTLLIEDYCPVNLGNEICEVWE